MSGPRLTIVLVLATVAFIAGRELHGRRMSAARAPTAVAAVLDMTRAPTAVRHGGSIAGLLRAIAVSVKAVPPKNDLERRVAETLHDSPAMRELRHELQRQAIFSSVPQLASAVVDQMVAVNDAFTEQSRADRAAFLLGDMNEAEYFSAIKLSTRESMDRMRRILPREDFEAAFHFRYDSDAFDPTGVIAPPPSELRGEPDMKKVSELGKRSEPAPADPPPAAEGESASD